MPALLSDSYAARLTRVSSYIHDHLDEDLNLEVLAQTACLSPYHWHRIYQAHFGETVAATVRRLRLQRAAADLAHTTRSVAEIAARAGYESQASFTRAFSTAFGLPPARYRETGRHSVFRNPTFEGATGMYDLTVTTTPATPLIAVDHRGSYLSIGKSFDLLMTTLVQRQMMQPGMRMIGLYLDDPTRVPEPDLRSQAAVTASESHATDAPLVATSLRGGDYAVLKYKGPYGDMRAAYDWLFGQWLPSSGREPADAPMFEEYLNSPRETPPTELRTDIYLPLR